MGNCQVLNAFRTLSAVVLVLGAVWAVGCAPKGPSPQDVLARYIEIAGGEEALEGVTSRLTEGEFSIPDMGYTGAFKQVALLPDRLRMSISVDGSEMAASGVTDGLAWDHNPMSGARVLQDAEKRIALRGVSVDPVWAWRDTFSSATFQESSEEGPNLDILLKSADGEQIICSFSKETGRLERTILFLGTNRVSQKYSDYREVSGLLIAFRIDSEMGGLKLGFQMNNVELNASVDESAFELPEQIKKLVGQ